MFLLDTNTSSYIIKGNAPHIRERLARTPMAEVAISVITEAELRFGVARKPAAVHLKKVIDEFLIRVNIFPWDSHVGQQYARLRATLETSGLAMGNLDLMIAAHAIALDATLVTRDRVFSRIKEIRVVDWAR